MSVPVLFRPRRVHILSSHRHRQAWRGSRYAHEQEASWLGQLTRFTLNVMHFAASSPGCTTADVAGSQVNSTPAPVDGNQPAAEATLEELLQHARDQVQEIRAYHDLNQDPPAISNTLLLMRDPAPFGETIDMPTWASLATESINTLSR